MDNTRVSSLEEQVARLTQRVEGLYEEAALARMDPVAVQKRLSRLHGVEIPGTAVRCIYGAFTRISPQRVAGCLSPLAPARNSHDVPCFNDETFLPKGCYVAAFRIARVYDGPTNYKFSLCVSTNNKTVLGQLDLDLLEVPANEWNLYVVKFSHDGTHTADILFHNLTVGHVAVDVVTISRT